MIGPSEDKNSRWVETEAGIKFSGKLPETVQDLGITYRFLSLTWDHNQNKFVARFQVVCPAAAIEIDLLEGR